MVLTTAPGNLVVSLPCGKSRAPLKWTVARESSQNHFPKLSCVLHFGNGGGEYLLFETLVSTAIKEAHFNILLQVKATPTSPGGHSTPTLCHFCHPVSWQGWLGPASSCLVTREVSFMFMLFSKVGLVFLSYQLFSQERYFSTSHVTLTSLPG